MEGGVFLFFCLLLIFFHLLTEVLLMVDSLPLLFFFYSSPVVSSQPGCTSTKQLRVLISLCVCSTRFLCPSQLPIMSFCLLIIFLSMHPL